MSSKRPPFEPILAAWDWGEAIAWYRKGRRDLLHWMLAEATPAEHRAAVIELLARPPPEAKAPKRAFLKHDAIQIRALCEARRAAGQAPKVVHYALAKAFGVSSETIRDIHEGRHSYADLGEQIKKPSPRKRVHHKK
jgi:hypothetical protein